MFRPPASNCRWGGANIPLSPLPPPPPLLISPPTSHIFLQNVSCMKRFDFLQFGIPRCLPFAITKNSTVHENDNISVTAYRNYPKYSDTVNVQTTSFFLKRHIFYVPYISRHVPSRAYLLSVNVQTPKTCPLFLIKLLFFNTDIFCLLCLPVFPVSVIDKPFCLICIVG